MRSTPSNRFRLLSIALFALPEPTEPRSFDDGDDGIIPVAHLMRRMRLPALFVVEIFHC